MATPCLSRPKEPSWSFLAGALPLLDSWCSPHSQALPSLVFPTSNVGRAESVCCLGSAAKSRGDHEFAPTRPCDKFCNKKDWVLSQHLWAQSQRIAQHHSFNKLASSCTFFWNVTAGEAHQHRSRHHVCQWYRPTAEEHGMASVPPAPVDSKRLLILWTTSLRAKCGQKRRIMSFSKKLCWITNTLRKENSMCWRKKQH